MQFTDKGAPYPSTDRSDPNNVPLHLKQLADWTSARPGVSVMSTTQRNALSGVDLWEGRVIANTTTGQVERRTGTRWDALGGLLQPLTQAQIDGLSNPVVGQLIFNTTMGRPEIRGASGWVPLACLVEVFATSATWAKPPGAKAHTVIVFGGGASGSAEANQQQYANVAGGAGGARAELTLLAAALGSTVSVTVGAGGTSASATDGGGRVNGSPGGTSSFGPVAAQGGGQPGDPTSPAVSAPGGTGYLGASPALSRDHRALGPGGGGGASRGYGSDSYSGGSPAGTSGVARSGTGMGGDGGNGASSGTPGQIPGGGGGAAASTGPTSSGAGARGEVIVITYF